MGKRGRPKKAPAYPCVYVADTETTLHEDRLNGYTYAYLLDMQRIEPGVGPSGLESATWGESFYCRFKDHLVFQGPDAIHYWQKFFLERIPKNAEMWFYNTAFDVRFLLDELVTNCGYSAETWDELQDRRTKTRLAVNAYTRTHPEYRTKYRWEGDDLIVTNPKQKRIPKEEIGIDPLLKHINIIRSGTNIIMCEIINSVGNKLTIMDVSNKWVGLPDQDEHGTPITGVEALGTMFGTHKTHLELTAKGPCHWPDQEELVRCAQDTKIIKLAMEKMYEMGLNKVTLAADAWSIFTAIEELMTGNSLGYGQPLGDKAIGHRIYKLLQLGFTEDEIYSFMDTVEDDGILLDLPEKWTFDDKYVMDIRNAYMGGVTMVHPAKAGHKIKAHRGHYIAHIDCNSMHPSSMIQEMPYGAPTMSYDAPTGEFYIISCYCTFRLKEGRFPTVARKGRHDDTMWLTEGDERLTMTSDDWKWFTKNYDYTIMDRPHYLNWHVRKNEALNLYVEFIGRKKAECKRLAKQARDPIEKTKYKVLTHIYKILLNSLYGKWGQNPEKAYEWLVYDNGIRYKQGKVSKGEFDAPKYHKYLPMACAVTARSRDNLWNSIEKIGWDNFIYGDTDSVFFITSCQTSDDLKAHLSKLGIKVHPTELGAWDAEHGRKGADRDEIIDECKFLRAKVYALRDVSGNMTIKMAGCPIKARLEVKTLNGLYFGRLFKDAKLIPDGCPGGTDLIPVDFNLREHGA